MAKSSQNVEALLALLKGGKPVMLAEYRGHKIVSGTKHAVDGPAQGRAIEYHRVEHAIECELGGEVAVHTVSGYLPDGTAPKDYVPPARRGDQVTVVVSRYGKVGNKGQFAFQADIVEFGREVSDARVAPPVA